MDIANAYARIIKSEKQEDGTLLVYGKATDDSLDVDQQICDATWLDRAMPDWFKTGGNIREQHSNIAAGVAKEYEPKKDGHYITALVVDPTSIKKVETGVLKGFSIGIKSPRIVRDTKAVNGRIIDGQIVEVSLVDRPANPNAKLMLAKSVAGETNLVKVEEMIVKGKATSLVEAAKVIAPTVVKFDQKLFESARNALAQLIISEAGEMTSEGSDESVSLDILLNAVKALFDWYNHEAAEGETMELNAKSAEDVVETKADDTTTGCDCAGCKECKDSGGCDSKMCSGHKSAKDAEPDADEDDATKTVEETPVEVAVEKCLECGCAKPADAHGTDNVVIAGGTPGNEVANVSTADMVSPEESPKSANQDSTDKTEDNLLNDPQIAEILEKAVKSASDSVRSEIESFKTATEAAEKRISELETELAVAVTKAVAGGPKRSVVKAGNNEIKNDLLLKAGVYTRKAASTSDPDLASGYRKLAKEFIAKANGDLAESE